MQGFEPLKTTFAGAERRHPDLMEPYATRLGEADTDADRMEIMRTGLRETFRARYPMPEEFWPKTPVIVEGVQP